MYCTIPKKRSGYLLIPTGRLLLGFLLLKKTIHQLSDQRRSYAALNLLHVMVTSFSGTSSASAYSDQDLQSRSTFAQLTDDFLERAVDDTKARALMVNIRALPL
jgi:hypothetical protein